MHKFLQIFSNPARGIGNRQATLLPLLILLLGAVALAMTFVIDRLHRQLSMLATVDGDVHSAQTYAALSHLWVEEFVSGDPIEPGEVVNNLARAARVIEDIEAYATTPNGYSLLVFADQQEIIRTVASIRQALVKVTDISLGRMSGYRNGNLVGIGSPSDVELDAAFGSLLAQLRLLDTFFNDALAASEARSNQLLKSIGIVWVFVVGMAVLGLWNRERNRFRADTARLESERQLLRSQKMEAVGRLASGIAHDVNNHLASVITQCEC